MPMIDHYLVEIDQEAVATRRLLDRVPAARFDWRPHPKSFTLGQLALHVASIPSGVAGMAIPDVCEMPDFQQAEAENHAQIMTTFDEGLVEARRLLAPLSDEQMVASWSLTRNGETVMTMPRMAVIRTILCNHLYHHRGQLTVYLRELDVPLPSVYGPTADEPFA